MSEWIINGAWVSVGILIMAVVHGISMRMSNGQTKDYSPELDGISVLSIIVFCGLMAWVGIGLLLEGIHYLSQMI